MYLMMMKHFLLIKSHQNDLQKVSNEINKKINSKTTPLNKIKIDSNSI